MWLSQLALINFRNFAHLRLELQPGVLLFCGQNGQGKTNLLESVYVLATTRSPRTSSERELLSWRAPDDPDLAAVVAPFARLEAHVRRLEGEVHLELTFEGERTSVLGSGAASGGTAYISAPGQGSGGAGYISAPSQGSGIAGPISAAGQVGADAGHVNAPGQGNGGAGHVNAPSQGGGGAGHVDAPSQGSGGAGHLNAPGQGGGGAGHVDAPGQGSGGAGHVNALGQGSGAAGHVNAPGQGSGAAGHVNAPGQGSDIAGPISAAGQGSGAAGPIDVPDQGSGDAGHVNALSQSSSAAGPINMPGQGSGGAGHVNAPGQGSGAAGPINAHGQGSGAAGPINAHGQGSGGVTSRGLARPGNTMGAVTRGIKVNGLATRATGLVGQLPVVYFSPIDVELAGGPPAGRRQYLNLANSQVSADHLRALQRYNRVLLQRNQVLRLVRERRQPPSALEPWTEQMLDWGARILHQRLAMLRDVDARLPRIFSDLAGTDGTLRVVYRSTAIDADAGGDFSVETLRAAFRERQAHLAQRETDQSVSLVGPHRDDFTFMLDDVDLNTYGSRGQQRLAVLALKLAEADWMRSAIGELPVVLLDDVLSELDPQRRAYVLQRVAEPEPTGQRQVWITTTETEPSRVHELLRCTQRFVIDAGRVRSA